MVKDVQKRWGAIDLLINNAGSNDNRSVKSTTAQQYTDAFENNCLSAILATQAVLPEMLTARHGAIVNISSILGQWASATSAAYSVSKYALTGFTDALRQSLVGTGVHVLGVYPGYIRTAMTAPFVKQGTARSRVAKSPEQMANAIWRALRHKKPELYYPWYVPWVLRLHRWMPLLADRVAMKVKR